MRASIDVISSGFNKLSTVGAAISVIISSGLEYATYRAHCRAELDLVPAELCDDYRAA